MPDTLDSLQHEFSTYRQAHRRGAYPLELRRRAVGALSPAQLLQLAARLGLTAAQVARWPTVSEVQDDAASGFFEVAPAAPPATVAERCAVEVETRSGAKLRLSGEIEPQLLAALVEVLQRAAP